MGKIASRLTRFSALLFLSQLAACASSPPSTWYLLTALPDEHSPAGGEHQQALAIGVGPVRLPKYLDRPEIVTRESENQLALLEFDRWAEPLTDNFASVLADNLAVLLSTQRVLLYPWVRSMPIDYQVMVTVSRFDNRPGGDVLLRARWAILRKNEQEVLTVRQSSFSETVSSASHEGLVAAQSRLVARLSEVIAAEIRTLAHR
jgi:uncharacterized lipoprotein YmbA